MRLNCVNIPTVNVERMRDFYSLVLQAPYDGAMAAGSVRNSRRRPVHCYLPVHTPVEVNPESCGLEFVVDDVDAEYKRLLAAGVVIKEPPVTYPWNWRAIGFQDPDGNHIDFDAESECVSFPGGGVRCPGWFVLKRAEKAILTEGRLVF